MTFLHDAGHRSFAGQMATMAAALLVVCGAARPPLAAPPAAPAAAKPQTVSKADAKPDAAALVQSTPYTVAFTDKPIKIDGVLNDEAWKRARVIDTFSMPWLGEGNRPARKATRARLLWDRDNLYVAGDMDDADLYADITEHDGNTWENDVFELFVKPSVEKPAYYEFQVTPNNTMFDMFLPRRGHVARFRRLGTFEIESAVSLKGTLNDWVDRDTGWSVELRIPWKDLARTGGRPEPGDDWKFALCRYDYDVDLEKAETSTCAPMAPRSNPNFHDHEHYATLHFEGPTNESSSKPFGMPRFVAMTTSKVVGSPDPLPPYTVVRSHPAARISGLTAVAAQPGSDRLLYITMRGQWKPSQVMRMKDDPDSFQPEVLLPINGGLHYSITFHPRFAENGYVYVGSNWAKPPDAQRRTRITRYTIDREPPYTFHPESEKVIIEWDSAGHDGGDMAFGADGMMYVTSGDGSSDSDTDLAGQDLSRLRSKVLRIDVDHPDEGRAYGVPRDNPFVDVPGARPETWAYGLRNPWRISIDRETNQIWVGNNGQDLWEQVYLIERGANYGWSILEGSHSFDADRTRGPTPFSMPIAEHSHAEARSLTGGFVYRGSALPELRGAYLYGDYSTGRIWAIRHDGARVTEHRLIADTQLMITCFGTDSRGELLITDFQPAEEGGFYRLVPRPPAESTANFPRRLSETGLFTSVPRHEVAPGVIPYDVNAPAWHDGAHASRFLVLPATGGTAAPTIDVTDSRGWKFADGTVAVQSLAIETRPGDPHSRRWVETRLLHRYEGEWAGYSYEWNDEQTDAVLVEANGKDREFQVAGDAAAGSQVWHYPSRTECMVCHSRAASYVLGLATVQLNRDFDYKAALGEGHATDNQLRTIEHLGVMRVNWQGNVAGEIGEAVRKRVTAEQEGKGPPDETEEARKKRIDQLVQTAVRDVTASRDVNESRYRERRSVLLTHAPERINRLVDPYDTTADLTSRACSYLQANCSCCHIGAGGGNSQIELEYLSAYFRGPLDKMKVIDVVPMHATFDLPDAKIVAAGHPERSVLLSRVSRRGAGQMPQLGTSLVDPRAVALIREWIDTLAARPAASTQASR